MRAARPAEGVGWAGEDCAHHSGPQEEGAGSPVGASLGGWSRKIRD